MSTTHNIDTSQANQTVAAILRSLLPDHSWAQVRRVVEIRRVKLNGELCLDSARRVKEGDVIELLGKPTEKPRTHDEIVLRHVDEHIVVVEKPSGVNTVRHPSEREWSATRKELSPTLEDIVPRLLVKHEGSWTRGKQVRLRIVQRLDKETSGLLVFARSVLAERILGKQFREHTVLRRYLALVPGVVESQTIESNLVRDRSDGRRGSTDNETLGKVAITHVEVKERLPGYTLLECRLETGRTHQIRIHLAELGHPVCGERVYNRPPGAEPWPDESGAPRLALHAAELGFDYPVTNTPMRWEMPFPADLQGFLERLRHEHRD